MKVVRFIIIVVILHAAVIEAYWIVNSLPKRESAPQVAVSSNPEVNSSPSEPRLPIKSSEAQQPLVPLAPGPMTVWTSFSDGYTWRSATEEEKRELVRRLAKVSLHGTSAEVFYDALDGFYAHPERRKEKLDLICTMVDAGEGVLRDEREKN